MSTERKESAPANPVRELYGAYRELEAVRRAKSNNAGVDTLVRMEEQRQLDLHQRLIDFFLTRDPEVGIVTVQTYKIAARKERFHLFSKNKFSLTLPSPLEGEDTFTVVARLSDLRRPGSINNSLKVRDLIAPQELIPESQPDFIIRTFEELAASEKYRQRKLTSNLNEDRSQLAPLKDLQESLIIGRLMALSQTEDVPGLRITTTANQKRIDIQTNYQGQSFSQDFNASMPRSPQEHKDILRNAGFIVH